MFCKLYKSKDTVIGFTCYTAVTSEVIQVKKTTKVIIKQANPANKRAARKEMLLLLKT